MKPIDIDDFEHMTLNEANQLIALFHRKLIAPETVARMLRISPRTEQVMFTRRCGPRYFRVGGHGRVTTLALIEEFLAARATVGGERMHR